jgi:glycosyltransferase involved in cell wall biosynthesis
MKLILAHGAATDGSGSGRYILDLAERFAEDGHDVTLCCHECEPRIETKRGVRVVKVARPSGRLGTWRLGFHWHLHYVRRLLRRAFAGERFDALLGSDLLFCDALCRHFGRTVAFIYTPLSMIAPIEIESYKLGGLRSLGGVSLYKKLQRRALERCDRVVRFTESGLRALETYYGVDLQSRKLIAAYVSREFESGGPAESSPPPVERPSPRELLWVGRLVPSKNVAFLIRAVALLRSTDWVLVICSDGPERPMLEALSRELRVNDKVRFLGRVDDMAAQYLRASLLLTASVLEQYSLTILEGYAFAVPCIGLKPDWKTVFNGNEDQIADGVTGFLVTNEQEMARRVDQLLGDEPLRQQLAAEAYRRKQAELSFEDYYRSLQTAVTSTIAGLRS